MVKHEETIMKKKLTEVAGAMEIFSYTLHAGVGMRRTYYADKVTEFAGMMKIVNDTLLVHAGSYEGNIMKTN